MNRLLCILLSLVLLVGAATEAGKPLPRAQQKKQARTKLNAIHSQMKEVKQDLREAKVRKRTYASQLQDTQKQLSQTKHRIYAAETRLRDTQSDLRQTKRSLSAVRSRLKQRNDLLGERLVATQRRGSVSYAAVLFNASDYWDYLSRQRLMAQLVKYDVELVQAIRADEREVLQWQNRLTSKHNEQQYIVQYLDRQRVLREGLRHSQASQVRAAARDQARYEEMLAELEENSNQIAAFIRRLEATPAGRARSLKPFRGGFSYPVNGRRTSGFGMRFHPVLHRHKLHTGVDFGAPTGTPIRAAATGVVVHAGWWGAYGNAVIVDHGGGVTTLYGHMSSIGCRSGQTVKRGQTIGRVGNTGWSTGPHLHFEVRRNGVPVNPGL